jgi:hypothetical protein
MNIDYRQPLGAKSVKDPSLANLIFVLLDAPAPHTVIPASVVSAFWNDAWSKEFMYLRHAIRTDDARDPLRKSRIPVVQPEWLYDTLSGANTGEALQRWNIR